jgi:plastocyanin
VVRAPLARAVTAILAASKTKSDVKRPLSLSPLVLAFALAVAACGGGSQPSQAGSQAVSDQPSTEPAPVKPGPPVDPATAGRLTGRVVFQGTPPPNPPIAMTTDPVCTAASKGTTPHEEWYEVGPNGGLGDVFVYVKSGLANHSYPVPTTPVTIDQKGCQYEPHVFGIRAGQPLLILNSDPTLHNIHAMAQVNQEFNTGQPLQGMKTTHVFTDPEVMLPFKCDVHRWMHAYAGVMPDPYFAVSGRDGAFSIDTLPPGHYVLAAWHEKLGEQTMNVTIDPKQTAQVTFTFDAPKATK